MHVSSCLCASTLRGYLMRAFSVGTLEYPSRSLLHASSPQAREGQVGERGIT